jgi:hypothetical protein
MAHDPGDDRYSVSIVDIDDPAAANAGSELFDFHAVQLQSRPFKVRRIIVRLDTATVVFHSTNVPVRTRTRVRAGLLAYVTYGPQSVGTVNGLPVRPGLLLSVPSGMDHLLVTSENWESIAFLLPPDDVRAHLMVRGRDAEFHVPEGIEPLQVDSAKVEELFEWGKRLVSAALLQPTMFDEASRECTAAREELFEIVLSTLNVADRFESEPYQVRCGTWRAAVPRPLRPVRPARKPTGGRSGTPWHPARGRARYHCFHHLAGAAINSLDMGIGIQSGIHFKDRSSWLRDNSVQCPACGLDHT